MKELQVVNVQLALEVFGLKRLGHIDVQETLAPADLFAGGENKNNCQQREKHIALRPKHEKIISGARLEEHPKKHEPGERKTNCAAVLERPVFGGYPPCPLSVEQQCAVRKEYHHGTE
jgi:hypothetical protein